MRWTRGKTRAVDAGLCAVYVWGCWETGDADRPNAELPTLNKSCAFVGAAQAEGKKQAAHPIRFRAGGVFALSFPQ
jgi:hypothetical protein